MWSSRLASPHVINIATLVPACIRIENVQVVELRSFSESRQNNLFQPQSQPHNILGLGYCNVASANLLAEEAGMIAHQTCTAIRSGLFSSSQSSSWSQLGNFSLGLEDNLGYEESGTYGLDTISLGFSNATGGPTLTSQVVEGIATEDYHVGIFGLGVQGTNLTTFNATKPSYLTTLKSQGLIPSLSWAYTAGAKYRE